MQQVKRDGEDFIVDAELLSEIFAIPPAMVQAQLRDEVMTTMCEAGEDKDAGRWRLTFRNEDKVCRLIVDDAGTILQRLTFGIRAPVPGGAPSEG